MSGAPNRRSTPAPSQAALLSELLHGGTPGLVEVVSAIRSREGRLHEFRRGNFVRAGQPGELLAALRRLQGPARAEFFFTPATLARPHSGNESVESLVVAWVDLDDPVRLYDLGRFPHAPHAVVASGSGGAHAYWRLARPVSAPQGESLNRRLAAAVGADLVSANRGRILRVPGTLNFKSTTHEEAPRACRLLDLDASRPRLDPDILARGLDDPRRPPTSSKRAVNRSTRARERWRALEAGDYYRLLTGEEPGRGGLIRCPSVLHEDRHPSARLYRGAGRGWFCFACGAGGGPVDMVAALRGWPTGSALRGEQFALCVEEVRRRLEPAGLDEPSPG